MPCHCLPVGFWIPSFRCYSLPPTGEILYRVLGIGRRYKYCRFGPRLYLEVQFQAVVVSEQRGGGVVIRLKEEKGQDERRGQGSINNGIFSGWPPYYVRPNRSPNSRHASRTRNFHGVISPPRLRTVRESQRDSVPKPRVARNELPWVIVRRSSPTATRLWPIHSRPRA